VAIALVIAIGTGGYAGLTSTTEWRQASYDLSYRRLAMYDLRVDLATSGVVAEGALEDVVAALPSAAAIVAIEERLIVPTQVEVSTPTGRVLVRGEITGSDFSDGGPEVNSYVPFTGRLLTEKDAGRPVVMVERTFAKFYDMGDTGIVAVSGGRELEFVGQASTPEYFTVAPEGEMFMTEATFVALFTTLETAQELAEQPGRVNNLVLTLTDEADREQVMADLNAALASVPVGTTVSTRDNNLSYTALTTDIDQDQALFNALAILLLAGAVGAAFNLIHRLAEQQRREVGIGMALGVRPRVLAVRPLLVSAEIAALGVVFGIGVGLLIGNAMEAVFTGMIPLPVWVTDFQVAVFARVAALGLAVPFLASVIPVWRAVRVTPVQAIKPDLTGRGSISGSHHRSVRNTFAVLPFRNLRRTPRRTILTVLSLGAAMTVLVGFLGIMDSVYGAIDTAEQQATAEFPERMTVGLDTFYLTESSQFSAVGRAETVAIAEPVLRLPGSLRAGADEIDVFVELADHANGVWRPTRTSGTWSAEPGVLLAEKAASDLGVTVGDTVILRHPRREGPASYTFVESELPVLATHPHPLRGVVYMDLGHADVFNLRGVANAVNLLPQPGFTTSDVQRELFLLDQVASVQSVTAVTDAVRGAFDQILGVVQVMVVVVLLLALLIAFNAAAINLDARAREHATMFAFGVKVRTALRIAVTESLSIGILATILGFAGGLAMVWWMTKDLLAETLPEFGLNVVLRAETVGVVAVMGVLAVAVAPLFTARRMRRMDIPGTLRLVE
jgi:putative ABC transport system permease protein